MVRARPACTTATGTPGQRLLRLLDGTLGLIPAPVETEQGTIVESGPHADLVDAGGNYARLWTAWADRATAGPGPTRRGRTVDSGGPSTPQPRHGRWTGPPLTAQRE
ncbi:hypothetical protein GA0070216_108127 [Micromonospora matsumotoense]|uniref:ATP-binding cassette, subfamily B n=1 Tax=Micromonospora matsumotoense TaxID=121616 RepID=A0A1C4Z3R0_9ACTN|nr:hypothetical protein GA0070216_108127 [Micromonospora matsumotoense]